jgi:hypothetical protein
MQVLAGRAMADRGRSREKEEGAFLGSDGKASPELDGAFARWTAHVDLVRQRGESWFQELRPNRDTGEMPKVAYPVWQHLTPFLEGVGAQEFLDHHWDAAQLFVKKPWFEKGFSILGGHSSISWGCL